MPRATPFLIAALLLAPLATANGEATGPSGAGELQAASAVAHPSPPASSLARVSTGPPRHEVGRTRAAERGGACPDGLALPTADGEAQSRVCRFADADEDGEHDATDLCPFTRPHAAVDSAGCSQAQFCASVEIRHWRDARSCRFVDWRNDEMFQRARDCRLADTRAGFICVAW